MNDLSTGLDVTLLFVGIGLLAWSMTLVLLPKSRVVYDYRRKKDVYRTK